MSDPDPRRVLVRVCQPPASVLPPLKSTAQIGGNQGNLLFQFSTARALAAPGTELSWISYQRFKRNAIEAKAERINAECDHLVMPMSSSLRFRMGPKMHQWANLIDKLTVPVTVVGIGAQLSLEEAESGSYRPGRVTGQRASKAEVEEHEDACRRFLFAVLDHSDSIGVRGDITADYLTHLGIPRDRVDVIGCPSLFLHGPGYRLPEATSELTPDSTISLSFDHRIPDTAEILDRTFNEYSGSNVYAQEWLTAKMVITGEETRAEWHGDERFPVHTSHRIYRDHRMLYYPTAWAWMDSLKQADFAFGPRLHGTVAALLAGIPVNLLAHDSRTVEVAQKHGIPYHLVRDLKPETSAAELFAAYDPTAFNSRYDELFSNFRSFLARNSLVDAYGPDAGGLEAFDAALAKARRVKPRISAEEASAAAKEAPTGRWQRAKELLTSWRR